MFAAIIPAAAGDDAGLVRMALCQDSWVEWSKSDPARLEAFAAHFRNGFSPHDNDPYWLPKANVSVLGLRVLQAFPHSVGMGVGLSLTVDAPFDDARRVMEKALGKRLGKCETGEGMKNCELEIAPQRSVVLMAEDSPRNHQTLIGCYYFYEK
jgi:hypothetical protein